MRTRDTDRLGDEISELAAHLDAATHRLLRLIRQFDEAGGWADQGADLPLVGDALRRSQVSYFKVRALTRVATPGTEETLLEVAVVNGVAARTDLPQLPSCHAQRGGCATRG